MEINYYQKYLKYKSKYLELKKLIGSGKSCAETYPTNGSKCRSCCNVKIKDYKANKSCRGRCPE